MSSYRLRRRAFLAGLGGAVGLRILLENLEASAEGASSPPRLLLLHWPLGTVRQQFLPTGTGRTYVTSPILRPFETAGLRDDLIVLYGLSFSGIDPGHSGGLEGGTVMATTGADIPGTRQNGGEADDGVAGGPSFDQIFLRHVPELKREGLGSVTAIGDARVESFETSSICLSYSHVTRRIPSANPSGGTIAEHIPILPTVSPNTLFASLFAGFMPGADPAAAARAVKLKRSVLDSALRELARIRTLAPASQWEKLDAHAEAIRRVELELGGEPGEPGCSVPAAPDAGLMAKVGSQFPVNARVEYEDASNVAAVGKAMLAVVRAAFQCDIVRVAAFQWSSAVSQVAFKGMYPTDPDGSYVHRRTSMAVVSSATFASARPSDEPAAAVYDFIANVHTWFNQQTADALVEFKGSTDVFGGNLLDHTIVPFVTSASDPTGMRNPLPALILGGKALGMQGGQFQQFATNRPHNDLWMSIAQAYLKTADPVTRLADEVFAKTNVAPIAGLWAPAA
jgi:hypothetical protein